MRLVPKEVISIKQLLAASMPLVPALDLQEHLPYLVPKQPLLPGAGGLITGEDVWKNARVIFWRDVMVHTFVASQFTAIFIAAKAKGKDLFWYEWKTSRGARISEQAREAVMTELDHRAGYYDRCVAAMQAGQIDLRLYEPRLPSGKGLYLTSSSPELLDKVGFDRDALLEFLRVHEIPTTLLQAPPVQEPAAASSPEISDPMGPTPSSKLIHPRYLTSNAKGKPNQIDLEIDVILRSIDEELLLSPLKERVWRTLVQAIPKNGTPAAEGQFVSSIFTDFVEGKGLKYLAGTTTKYFDKSVLDQRLGKRNARYKAALAAREHKSS